MRESCRQTKIFGAFTPRVLIIECLASLIRSADWHDTNVPTRRQVACFIEAVELTASAGQERVP